MCIGTGCVLLQVKGVQRLEKKIKAEKSFLESVSTTLPSADGDGHCFLNDEAVTLFRQIYSNNHPEPLCVN